jgi:hypothetical protein
MVMPHGQIATAGKTCTVQEFLSNMIGVPRHDRWRVRGTPPPCMAGYTFPRWPAGCHVGPAPRHHAWRGSVQLPRHVWWRGQMG